MSSQSTIHTIPSDFSLRVFSNKALAEELDRKAQKFAPDLDRLLAGKEYANKWVRSIESQQSIADKIDALEREKMAALALKPFDQEVPTKVQYYQYPSEVARNTDGRSGYPLENDVSFWGPDPTADGLPPLELANLPNVGSMQRCTPYRGGPLTAYDIDRGTEQMRLRHMLLQKELLEKIYEDYQVLKDQREDMNYKIYNMKRTLASVHQNLNATLHHINRPVPSIKPPSLEDERTLSRFNGSVSALELEVTRKVLGNNALYL